MQTHVLECKPAHESQLTCHADGDLGWQCEDLLQNRNEWWVPGKIVEIRRRLEHVWRVRFPHRAAVYALLTETPGPLCGGKMLLCGRAAAQRPGFEDTCWLILSSYSILALVQNGASRDVLLLDIALDNWFRTQVQP